MTRCLEQYGFLLVKDPSVDFSYCNAYLDMMETYYEKRAQHYRSTNELIDSYPQYKHQIGLSCQNVGSPNYQHSVLNKIKDVPTIIPSDPKWKFFWPVREDEVYSPPICIPHDMPKFRQNMNNNFKQLWGTLHQLAIGLARSYGQVDDYFISKLKNATQYLVPVGGDLRNNPIGTIFSGFHYGILSNQLDLNFVTIHGPTRFPGLYTWLPNGHRIELRIPEGHILLQPGMQLEYMTGGVIKASYHEVVYNEETQQISNKSGRNWRVSNTIFSMLSNDTILQPIVGNTVDYQPITVEQQFQKELTNLQYK